MAPATLHCRGWPITQPELSEELPHVADPPLDDLARARILHRVRQEIARDRRRRRRRLTVAGVVMTMATTAALVVMRYRRRDSADARDVDRTGIVTEHLRGPRALRRPAHRTG